MRVLGKASVTMVLPFKGQDIEGAGRECCRLVGAGWVVSINGQEGLVTRARAEC